MTTLTPLARQILQKLADLNCPWPVEGKEIDELVMSRHLNRHRELDSDGEWQYFVSLTPKGKAEVEEN